ncbi:uncharacterized protein [Asterias amurensis]|uniref:uncharacterized protein n=1 Tax=Asterias amurensis TaxID=7602 RepID=UPI003AB19867
MASSCDKKNLEGEMQPQSHSNFSDLRLSDCKCPICMSILIEPVRMPCNHELCMPCFRQNVEEANFTCPMCRLRISNWARRCARENKLVDERRWRQIREAFPAQCQRRLAGEDEEEEEEEVLDIIPGKRICEPGAIKQEYKEAVEKLKCERQQMAEIEIQKSEEYIAWLQREEVRLYEEQQNKLAQQQQLDEELARKMSTGVASPIEEIRTRTLQEQTLKDEEYARKLQKEALKISEAVSSPNTTTIISKKFSRNSSSNGNTSTSSSMKCLRIDKFLSPCAKQASPQIQHTSKASSSKSLNNNSSPDLSMLSSSSHRASSSSSVSSISLDFDKPSTSKGVTKEPVLFGDPPWGDRSSSECVLEIVADPTSPTVSYPSPSIDESLKSLKDCLLNPEYVLDTQGIQKDERDNKKESAFESVKIKSMEAEGDDSKTLRKRSDSMTSTDSISPELNHFRPIDISPRTSHRRLANGRRESPKVVHTTPRNLTNLSQDEPIGDTSLPPLVKAKFDSLLKEKKKKLGDSSKSTMTGKGFQGRTSMLMRQELNRRLHHKPSGNRHTLLNSATQRQLTKPEKSPLAEGRVGGKTSNKHESKQNVSLTRKNYFHKGSRNNLKEADRDSDSDDVIMTDLDEESQKISATENNLNMEEVNARKRESPVQLEIPVQRLEMSSREKRKSCSPQLQRKKLRLEDDSSLKNLNETKGGSGDPENTSDPKKSPGKVYQMKMNQPKPKQSTIKKLFSSKDMEPEQNHSVSPKRWKVPSRSSQSPPLPSLVPSPHHNKLKTNTKETSVSDESRSENCQENISRFDRHKVGILTPDKGILMDAKQDSNQEKNGHLVKSVAPIDSEGKNTHSPETFKTNSRYSTAKSKSKLKDPPSPHGNERQKTSSPKVLQKTPSKTRRNTIWKYMELVSEEERRIQQEEEDRKLALKLQEEFDKQERRQMSMVDRSQGAESAYELRDRRRASAKKVTVDVDSDDDIFD